MLGWGTTTEKLCRASASRCSALTRSQTWSSRSAKGSIWRVPRPECRSVLRAWGGDAVGRHFGRERRDRNIDRGTERNRERILESDEGVCGRGGAKTQLQDTETQRHRGTQTQTQTQRGGWQRARYASEAEAAFRKVLDVYDDGWCMARTEKGATGLVPTAYLRMGHEEDEPDKTEDE
eukprot:630428-Rhodomonas_salina.1